MGYTNVLRYPDGLYGWKAAHPDMVEGNTEAVKPLTVGDEFPDCRVAVLNGDEDRQYLGLPPEAKWLDLTALKARFVLIQLYNTMCPECVNETKKLTKFFQTVEADPVLHGRLKIFGLGVYDDYRDVIRFKRHYDVAYPLFADKHGQIFECLGQAELPLAYLLRAEGDGRWTIELIKRGYFEPDEKFLQTLQNAVIRAEGTD